MIEVHGISKFYGDKKAVEGLSFRIDEGETIGLLGLNGAGKSTVLKILGCFLLPSSGEASLGGYSVTREAQDVRRQIGYLPDSPPLYPEMTVTAYLEFAAQLKGVAKKDLAAHVDQAMVKTSLQGVRLYRLSELSHGFRQRVGIAQALVHKPRVLILDEPINGLDPIQIVEMRDLIVSLKGDHTVLLSSHILSEITKTCDRILLIDQGKLVAEGTEQDLRHGVSQGLDFQIEWSHGPEGLSDQLRSIPGVLDYQHKINSSIHIAHVSCQQDIRADLARRVVESGANLLSLVRKEAELESLFMKLITKEHLDG